MGIFGVSKQEIKDKYEKMLGEKEDECKVLESECKILQSKINELVKTVNKYKIDSEINTKSEKPKNDNFVLSAGKYIGGKNISIGVFDLIILSGTGIIETDKPDKLFFRLESDPVERSKRNWSNKYNGMIIDYNTVLEIGETAVVKFYKTAMVDFSDAEKKYIENKKQYEDEINELLEEKKRLKNDIRSEMEVSIKKWENTNSYVLETGIYKIGDDLPENKYDVHRVFGNGYVECSKGNIHFRMSDHKDSTQIYRNLFLQNGSKLNVGNDVCIALTLSNKVNPLIPNNKITDIIECGKYKIGTDIKEGIYIFEVLSGSGYINDSDDICINLSQEQTIRVVLKKGKTLEVNGNLKIRASIPNQLLIKKAEKTNILPSGKYEAGIDIPYGYYNIIACYGQGYCELINNGNSLFYENFSLYQTEECIREYRNLLFSVGDVFEVEGDLEVELIFSKPYEDISISNSIIKDFEDIKNEIRIMNNNLIEKYYMFSNYEGITSQECKNKLLLLKIKEKEMRDNENDIVYYTKNKNSIKNVRKILRTFNSECDHQLLRIESKNINSVCNKISKTFESLNVLYESDGISLSKKILELKLEEATLMYTYYLKYEQEKEIQRAIKEQMIEEAKAEREIQEQKKKIEKDLQQHLGEVNRLMKYLQKSQIEAERQLYMDKIKELEDKIKVLESNKETVLEREANAKAGFVYIISNIGSFGENVYKIGMTRRLEPMDRIRELSSASVPFEFDVHAMIFSSNAPELENELHNYFSNKAVNKINPRKEFYNVSIDEIEKVVLKKYNDTVQFTKIPIAMEYRQSIEISSNKET